jgi:hypothetical protein
MKTKGLNEETCFTLFIDDYSRMTWVYFLKRKSESFGMFKYFKREIENETNIKVKCLRSNHGGEFTSKEFEIFYEDHVIGDNIQHL